MMLITALVQPFRVTEVRSTLFASHFDELFVGDCYGSGHESKLVESLRGDADVADILPKVKIELVVETDRVDEAVSAIMRAARLGKIGDGKIFVSRLDCVESISPLMEDLEMAAFAAHANEAAE